MAIYLGTPYDDSLIGEDGNDYLSGEDGNDILNGGYGSDTLIGGAGNDTLIGGIGFYLFDYLDGNDYLDGGAGDDSLDGSLGNDTLDGGDGDDSLDGSLGNDSLDGRDGDDSLNGGTGNDSLNGGQGSDRFIYTTSGTAFSPENFGVDVISDFETGTDKIVLDKTTFNSISSAVGTALSVPEEFAIVTSDVDAATSTADIVYNSVNGNLFYNPNSSDSGFGTGALLVTLTGAPTLVATDFTIKASPLRLYGSWDNDSLVGGDGDDSLDGNFGNDFLNGGLGNDFLDGGWGNDTLVGGYGNDSLYGGYGNSTLYGGYGNDSLYGEYGNHSLDGGDGDDSLDSGDGDDSLVGGNGNDSLNGGYGNDSLVGGEGSDLFVYRTYQTIYSPGIFGVDVISDFETGIDKIVLDKTAFNSISSAVGTGWSVCGEFAIVTSDVDAASSTADIVYNSVNGNLFYNPNGSDPGFGTDALLVTLTGAPPLVASDFMIEASPLRLVGGDGNDSLVGGDGNDYLKGGTGNDTLIGGLGNDSFVYSTGAWPINFGFGVDVIADFETGNDKIVLDVNDFRSISSAVGTGFSVPGEFAIVTCDAQAAISTADIVYNSVNGNLFYNPNGSDPGLGTGALFATLADAPTLVATDFEISHFYPIKGE